MSGGFFYFRKKKIIPKTNPQCRVFYSDDGILLEVTL